MLPIFAVFLILLRSRANGATVVTYDNEADFLAAASGVQTITFEGLPAQTTLPPLVLDGVTFRTRQREGFGGVDVVNSDLLPDNGRTYPPGTYVVMRSLYGDNIVLANATTAIGFQLFAVDPVPLSSVGSSLSVSFGRQDSPSGFAGISITDLSFPAEGLRGRDF
jgi:hypothetical protein